MARQTNCRPLWACPPSRPPIYHALGMGGYPIYHGRANRLANLLVCRAMRAAGGLGGEEVEGEKSPIVDGRTGDQINPRESK